MRDIPIIFSAPMIRALLDGRKTQTRRLIKKGAALNALSVFGPSFLLLPGNVDLIRYAVGDRLWVRESGCRTKGLLAGRGDIFRHDVPATPERGDYWCETERGPGSTYSVAGCSRQAHLNGGAKVCPSIHMPRWASRLTLVVEQVRVERLQDISEADAIAEGCPAQTDEELAGMEARGWFRDLWGSINGPGAWDANPWVVAPSFAVHRKNIDLLNGEAAHG
ncbi:hypothetical protein [Azospirillum tabaci]|uniref:hypothetical protein n=1 Tax=Azospirillum tabaci TaxID=2752310 RepID=UPI0016604C1B|nr:hypothetical protein [Azospirillum tabaci]